MSTKTPEAIMGVAKDDYDGINKLGQRLLDGYFSNTDIYTDPVMTQEAFTLILNDAVDAQANVRGGGTKATTLRNAKSAILHDKEENTILPDVNKRWRGNKVNLELSGFPVSKDAEPHGQPDAPVIKRIEKGPVEGSIRIILEKRTGSAATIKDALIYKVYKSTGATEESPMNLELTTTDSRSLIVYNVPRGQDFWYAVSVQHHKVGSLLCGKVKYMLN